MYILYKLLLVIHISAAAVTLGASTGLIRNLRRSFESSIDAFRLAADDATRRGKVMGLTGFMVLWTGLSLIFVRGGFKAVPVQIHIALTIMLGALVISLTVMRPTLAKVVVLAQSAELDRAAVPPLFKKLAMGQGMLHTAWLIMLILMILAS